jgi:hypothetical protein
MVATEATISLEREWGAFGIAEGPAWVGKKKGMILTDKCSPFPAEMPRMKVEPTSQPYPEERFWQLQQNAVQVLAYEPGARIGLVQALKSTQILLESRLKP